MVYITTHSYIAKPINRQTSLHVHYASEPSMYLQSHALFCRLCFWKEDRGLINPEQNFYMMVDAAEALLPQHVYRFFWLRDD